LHTAAHLFQRQGYGSTGLTQVLAESGAPKGVLYFHFPQGKEQLAAESVSLAGGELGARMGAVVSSAPDAGAAVIGLGGLFAAELESSGFRDGCPVATVALDAAGQSEPIRGACRGVYESWLDGLAAYLRSQGVPARKAADLASLTLSSLQGALLLARVQHDTSVIHSVTRQLGGLVKDAVRR
jgi:TetR/AcrR family transcriptional repressor of lmrAB and yxaGH operons